MGDVSYQAEGTLLSHFQPGHGPDWQTLVDELTEKPGRVLIDMTETLRNSLPDHVRTIADDVAYERARFLSENRDEDNIPRYEARRIFDEMRVALSRSTARLVLLESVDAPVLAELGIDPSTNVSDQENSVGGGLLAVGWDDLLETLRTEEMAELEVIEGYLDEVEDLAERGRWEQAYRRNRRAYDQAIHLGDMALQRETQEQHIDLHLQEATMLFERERWSAAYQCNRRAYQIAVAHGDPTQLGRVNEQRTQLSAQILTQANALHAQAQQWAKSRSYKTALQNADDAHKLATAVEETVLIQAIEQTTVRICRQWAYQLTDADAAATASLTGVTDEAVAHAIVLLDRSAKTLAPTYLDQSKLLAIIADRYRATPPNLAVPPTSSQQGQPARKLSNTQLKTILSATGRYITLLETADPLPIFDVEQSILLSPSAAESDIDSVENLATDRPTPQFITDLAAEFEAKAEAESEAESEAQEEEYTNSAADARHTQAAIQQELYLFPRRWLDEAFLQLGDRVEFYYLWAVTADRWIRTAAASDLHYPEFDEHLWELENRVEMMADQSPDLHERAEKPLARFDAFILGYHGESAQASVVWENLGEIELAAEQARNAGQIERAYDLLRRTDIRIPEALTLATKSLRQLEQLAQNPSTLRPEERQQLSEQLGRIQERLRDDHG